MAEIHKLKNIKDKGIVYEYYDKDAIHPPKNDVPAGKVLTTTENGVEWADPQGGEIDTSSLETRFQTIENNLATKASQNSVDILSNTVSTKADASALNNKLDVPTNTGSVNQVLTKTASGSEWKTINIDNSDIGNLQDLTTTAKDTLVAAINEAAIKEIPTGGTTGQVLTRGTNNTVSWANALSETDTTLSISGKPADAGSVGNKITAIESNISTLQNNYTANTNAINDLATSVEGKITAPAADGSSGQVLTTDGEGNISWSTVNTSTDKNLNTADMPADAAAVGERLSALDSEIDKKMDLPIEQGTSGQLLTKTSSGYEWKDFKIDKDEFIESVVLENNILTVTKYNGESVEYAIEEPELQFDGGRLDEEGYLHLTKETVDLSTDVFTPIFIGTGGGGSGTETATKITITNQVEAGRNMTVETGKSVILAYSWSSIYTEDNTESGDGRAVWTVDGTQAGVSMSVKQGLNQFDITNYLTAGKTNTVRVTVTDKEGAVARYTWNVTVVKVGLTWNITTPVAVYGSDDLSILFTPNGQGTKTLYYQIDDNEIQSRVIDSATRITIPAQSHGEHIIQAWMTVENAGELITTPKLNHSGIWTESSNTTPIIAIYQDTVDTQQFETTPIEYIAYTPGELTTNIELKENDVTVSSLTVNRNVQTWAYRPTTDGNITLTISTTGASDSIVVVSKKVDIDIAPVTDGLIMDLDPTGHSNAEIDRAQFGYKDKTNVNHPLTFSDNFDWINGGFQRDNDGVTAFVIKRGTSVTFDRSLFLAEDNTNGEAQGNGSGKHISFIFKTANVTDYDTQIAHSYDGVVGLQFNAHNASFKAGNTIECQYAEDYKVEFALNIDPGSEMMKLWLQGTPAKGNVFSSGKEGVKTVFSQDDPDDFFIGNAECDIWIYRFKMYATSLSDNEILQNFIADCGTVSEMIDRYKRNDIYTDGEIDIDKLMIAAPELHIITIETAGFPGDKGSAGKTDCKITHRIGNGVAKDQWEAINAKYTLQGTSSMNYRQVAGNLDLDMKKATMQVLDSTEILEKGYAFTDKSIPVKYFNLKANVASSENANNRCAAELFNRYNPLISAAKAKENSFCRDTVEGYPCAVFIKNIGEEELLLGVPGARKVAAGDTIFYFAGDMNNSKKNTNVFGQTSEWDDEEHEQCCIEFAENTLSRCTFKSTDFTDETWGEKDEDHFEFRYPDGAGTDAMKANFIAMHHWVNSTDPLQATNEPLAAEDQIDGFTTDSPEYRKAKFKAQAGNYFALNNLFFYYLFTEFFLAVDNRAKNMFMSYEPDADGVWKWNVSKFYDGDTILGIDNKGNFVWGEAYGIEDTDGYLDTSGTEPKISPYFNAAESVLWCNIRDCFSSELAAAYSDFENAGLFNAANLIKFFDDYQRIRPEALMIEDYAGKYDAPATSEVPSTNWMVNMEYGEKRLQRRQFLTYQEKYMSSKYVSSKAKTDIFLYQAKPGANFSSALEVTPYSDMYVGFLRDNVPAGKLRMKKGETATIQCLDGDGNPLVLETGELNIQLINGSNLKHVKGAAYLYPAQVNYMNGAKLQDILLGGEDYSSSYLKAVAFNSVPLVRIIDLRGQSGIGGEINLTRCSLLEELYLTGIGESDVYLPQTGTLRVVRLGSNIRTLHARNLPNVTAENFSGTGENLENVWIENAPVINTRDLVINAIKLKRIRILGINWSFTNANVLLRLAELKGYNANGDLQDTPVLTGQVHITLISEDNLAKLQSIFGEELVITYDTLAPSYSVSFLDYDGTDLNIEQRVAQGSSPEVPSLIPTRASTAAYDYAFDGWCWDPADATPIADITTITVSNDITLYAHYTATIRTYNVTWYNGVGGTELYSTSVQYGQEAIYQGSTPVNENDGEYNLYYLFKGWDKSTGYIESDLQVYAQYDSDTVPGEVGDLGWSNLTLPQIKGLIANGVITSEGASQYLQSGQERDISLGHDLTFTNVPSYELISEPRTFDANNSEVFIPQINGNNIQLFDSDKSWTLAIDFAFASDSGEGGCLAACYQRDGFRLLTGANSVNNISYGATSAQQVATSGKRQIIVLRKKQGDPKLYIYGSNKNEQTILNTSINNSATPTHTAPLAFGARVNTTGTGVNYGSGVIYWAKLWENDLGVTNCEHLVAWPHETITLVAQGDSASQHTPNDQFRTFAIADEDGFPARGTFVTKYLLEDARPWDSTGINVPWGESELCNWLNTRILNALPLQLQQLIVLVDVPTATPSATPEIIRSQNKIWIPSVKNVNDIRYNYPTIYDSEGEFGSFAQFVDNESRKKTTSGDTVARSWWLRTPYIINNTTTPYPNSRYTRAVSATGTTTAGYGNEDSSNVYVLFGFCI